VIIKKKKRKEKKTGKIQEKKEIKEKHCH